WLEGDFADGTHAGERGAELVRRVRREAAKLLERAVETRQRVVEDPGELSEFVVRVLHRQSCAQRVRGDLPRRFRHRADGRQDATGEEISTGDCQDDGAGTPVTRMTASVRSVWRTPVSSR